MNYNFKDRTGQKYGTLLVIRRCEDAVFPSGKLVQWECFCENCKKTVKVLGCNLNKVKSCGCIKPKSRIEDLTNQVFGELKVLKRAEDHILPSGQHQTMWTCECSCGTIKDIRAAHLKNNSIRSCGCVKSFGEQQIIKFLNSLKINYKREYVFPELVNSNNNQVRFDFAFLNQENQLIALLEFQGEQHYREKIAFGKMQREETDQLKKAFCLKNNILLFEIKYNDDILSELKKILNQLYDNTVLSAE